MDGRGALRGRPSALFKKKAPSKKGRWNDFRPEHHENTQIPNPTDTVYRILCPSKKIGSVIGKSGGIIKVLREETRSKITVSDTIPGSDERVIMIYSPPDNSSKKESDQGNEEPSMPPHCPAQDALLRVHDRIIEEDLLGGNGDSEDNNIVVTARLLVPNSMVGCLLGKGGDVIQRLRSETGANIRVLPSEHLPSCALSTDELVQIQGKVMVVKRALYDVSTLLHQNPRKEKALNVALPSRGPGFHHVGPPIANLPPGHDPMWSPRHPSPRMLPPPWFDEYERYPGFRPGRFEDDDLPRPGMEPSGEFSMKILCSASKIGGVIGKGGINVRQLQEDTGTSIHVEDVSSRSEERVIRVSAFETLATPRSQTIEAIIVLQSKSSEVSDKGVITTRLLVPSNKVGCLLGQGGAIINDMRRRTHADIRVYSKDEKPECASEDEELVQISGSFAVAKDALAEIADRLRSRCLRDAGTEVEPPPPRAFQGYGPTGSFPRAGPPVPGPLGISPSRGYNAAKGGMHDYEPSSYPVQPSASRYPAPNSSADARYHNSGVGSVPGSGGSTYAHNAEAAGMRMKHRDPYIDRSESMADNRGGSDRYHSYNGQNIPYQGSYSTPTGQAPYNSMASQQATYQNSYQNHHQAPYENQHQTPYENQHQTPYGNPNHCQTPYENLNHRQAPNENLNHRQTPYENPNHHQTPYENPNHRQTPYESHHQTPYQNHHQTPYQQTGAQQSPYQNATAPHTAYQSVPPYGGYQY